MSRTNLLLIPGFLSSFIDIFGTFNGSTLMKFSGIPVFGLTIKPLSRKMRSNSVFSIMHIQRRIKQHQIAKIPANSASRHCFTENRYI